jgi:trafficking protein particle complex subunit 10
MQVVIPQILAAVHFRIAATDFSAGSGSTIQLPPLYAGQPIPALISIHTSFHWGTSRDSGRGSYEMRFDIEEMVRDWLISGRKRGDFEAEVCVHRRGLLTGS